MNFGSLSSARSFQAFTVGFGRTSRWSTPRPRFPQHQTYWRNCFLRICSHWPKSERLVVISWMISQSVASGKAAPWVRQELLWRSLSGWVTQAVLGLQGVRLSKILISFLNSRIAKIVFFFFLHWDKHLIFSNQSTWASDISGVCNSSPNPSFLWGGGRPLQQLQHVLEAVCGVRWVQVRCGNMQTFFLPHTQTYIHMYIYIYICIHVCMYTCIYIWVYMWIREYMYIYIIMYLSIYV